MAHKLGAGQNPKAQSVLYWTQEDDLDEIRMRLSAAMRFHDISFEDTIDPTTGHSRLHAVSGVTRRLCIARFEDDRRTLSPSKHHNELLEALQSRSFAAAIFDPFTELHPANENDNNEIVQVAALFRSLATEANVAVGIVHHTRKHNAASSEIAAGDMDSARGAGSLQGVARISATLYNLDAKTAKSYGIEEDERKKYVRLDDAKSNLAQISHEPVLFERTGVYLHELDDEVGMLQWADIKKVKTKGDIRLENIEATQLQRAEDVRYVLTSMLGDKQRAVKLAVLVDALYDDAYEEGKSSPGRYTVSSKKSLTQTIKKMFSIETGRSEFEELREYALVKASERKYTFVKVGIENPLT